MRWTIWLGHQIDLTHGGNNCFIFPPHKIYFTDVSLDCFTIPRCEYRWSNGQERESISYKTATTTRSIEAQDSFSFVLWCHLAIDSDRWTITGPERQWREMQVYDWMRRRRDDLSLSLWCSADIFARQRSIFHLLSTVLSYRSVESQLNCRFRFIHGHRRFDVPRQTLPRKWSEWKSD